MVNTNNVLWLDVDGVLLEWVKPFLNYIKSPVKYEDLSQYDLSFLFKGSIPEMVEAINDFNATLTYMNLSPLISRDYLNRLKEFGWQLNVISQVDGGIQRRLRLKNLQSLFGNDMFHTIALTGRGTKKADLLREWEPYEIIHVVEDNPEFFKDAHRVGGFKPMAINHLYNRKELKEIRQTFDFPIYTDMMEVVRHLCS